MRILPVFLLIAIVSVASAAEADEFAAARQLISSNASCDSLNATQLGQIGDYLMELMHPGAAHEAMDQMMGGEGSPSLAQAHVQMAEVLYCGQTNGTVTYGGMMGMMPAMYAYGPGMMGYGAYGPAAMGYYWNASNQTPPYAYAPYGMMGYGGYGMMGYGPAYNASARDAAPGGYGQGMMGYGPYSWGGQALGGWGWLVGLLFVVLVLVALVLAIAWLYKQVRGGRPASPSDALKMRYAKGELTKKQFDEMMKDLA